MWSTKIIREMATHPHRKPAADRTRSALPLRRGKAEAATQLASAGRAG
jgi:hypothetical protein